MSANHVPLKAGESYDTGRRILIVVKVNEDRVWYRTAQGVTVHEADRRTFESAIRSSRPRS